MPYEYDSTKGLYKDGEQYVSRKEVRARLDGVLESLKVKAGQYARKYNDGEWAAKQFGDAMRELLESAHIAAGVLGRGGRESMQAKDWQRIEEKITWQNGFLRRYVDRLSRGSIQAASESRTKSYVEAVYVSYADSVAEARTEVDTKGEEPLVMLVQSSREGCSECNDDAGEWVPESELKPLFSRICGDWCACEILWQSEETNQNIRDWADNQVS